MPTGLRKVRLLMHLVRGLVLAALVLPRASLGKRDATVRTWSLQLLRLCGMRLVVHRASRAIDRQVFIVANHVSWIDIFAIDAWRPTRFVAKAEIAHWPVVGWLTRQVGTIFIQRDKPSDARRIVKDLAAMLSDGERICVFPEGTTSDGSGVLPFHANLLQAAVAAQAPVQPVTIIYEDAHGAQSSAAAFIGDMSMLDSINLIFKAAPLTAHLYIGEPVAPMDERRALANRARASVVEALEMMQREIGVGEIEPDGARDRLDATVHAHHPGHYAAAVGDPPDAPATPPAPPAPIAGET